MAKFSRHRLSVLGHMAISHLIILLAGLCPHGNRHGRGRPMAVSGVGREGGP